MSEAVFNEVLKISIDTASFAASMKEVEQIYAQSLQNMPNLSDMGSLAAANQFSAAARQISDAAASIESHVAEMSSDVEAAMDRVGTSAAEGGAAAAEGLEQIPKAASRATVSIANMVSGLATAMNRIPGRMAVIFAMKVALELLKAPFEFLAEGFKNLAEQSADFKTTANDLTNEWSKFQSVAAKPLFDTVLDAMHKVSQYAKENKDEINTFMDGIGKYVDVLAKVFGSAAIEVFTELKPILVVIALAFNDLALSIGLSVTGMVKLLELAANPENAKQIGKEALANAKELLQAHQEIENSLTGGPAIQGLDKGIVGKNEQPSISELRSQRDLANQQTKSAAQDQVDIVNLKEKTFQISEQEGGEKRRQISRETTAAIFKNEKELMDKLIEARNISGPDSKYRAEIDKAIKQETGGPVSGAGSGMSQAQHNAAKGELEEQVQNLKDQKTAYDRKNEAIRAQHTLEEQMAKEAAARHRETYLQAYAQENTAEQRRYNDQKANIAKMYGPDTANLKGEAAVNVAKATQENEEQHSAAIRGLEDRRTDSVVKDLQYQEQIVAAQNKSKTAVDEIAVKQAKLTGDKEGEMRAEQQLLVDKVTEARATASSAYALAAATKGTGPEGEKFGAAATTAQANATAAENEAKVGALTLDTRIANEKRREAEEQLKVKLAVEQTAEAEAKRVGSKPAQAIDHKAELQTQLEIAQSQLVSAQATADIVLSTAQHAKDLENVADKQKTVADLQNQIKAISGGVSGSPDSVAATEAAKTAVELARANDAQVKLTGNKHKELQAHVAVLEAMQKELDLNVKIAQANLAAQNTFGPHTEEQQAIINSLKQQLAVALAAQHTGATATNIAEINATGNGQALAQFGVNLGELTDNISHSSGILETFGLGLQAATTFLTNFGQKLATAYTDLKKGNIGGAVSAASQAAGGAAGAIGAIADSASQTATDAASQIGNAMGSFASSIPLIGGLIGGAVSMISQFFSTSIQNMVTDLQDQIQAIGLQASTKQIGIQQQIAELKQAEQTAQAELGGKKKAASQLQSIMQSLNSQIVTLEYQAAQTVQTFNDLVQAANTGTAAGNAVATQWLNTWTQVNQQVEAYIQAGGSAVVAAAYLNQQLQTQQTQLQTQLNSGNQTAISDALQLNQLEQQKVEMMQKEAQTEFGLLNSDSLERNVASAVATGQQLTQQREAYAEQITQLNYQLTTEQLKVAAETQIFNLATSTAALQAQSNALTLFSLQQQLNAYKEIQAILSATSGLSFAPGQGAGAPGAGLNGNQASIPGLPGVTGTSTVSIGTINVNTNGPVTATNAQSLGAAIAQNIASGRTNFSLPGY